MKTLKFEDRSEWLQARRGKVTGTRLKDIVVKRGTGEKMGFYELIAERLAVLPDDEIPMDRGIRLEEEAIELFSKAEGKKVDTSLLMWTRDDNESIAVSPDGVIGQTEAVECKCLSSALHIKSFLTKEIPDEYEFQTLQYFIVNDKLKVLHVVFYDPRFSENLKMFAIKINRKDVEEDIEEYMEYQRVKLAEVDRIVNELTF